MTVTSATRDINNASSTTKKLDKGAHASSPLAQFLNHKKQITSPRRYKPVGTSLKEQFELERKERKMFNEQFENLKTITSYRNQSIEVKCQIKRERLRMQD